jgi:hypothetical protein
LKKELKCSIFLLLFLKEIRELAMREALQAVGVYVIALTHFTAWWCRAIVSSHLTQTERKIGTSKAVRLHGGVPYGVAFLRDWIGGDYGFVILMSLLLVSYLALRRVER